MSSSIHFSFYEISFLRSKVKFSNKKQQQQQQQTTTKKKHKNNTAACVQAVKDRKL